MRYLLLIYTDPSQGVQPGTPEWAPFMAEYAALGVEMEAAGAFVAGHRLERADTARTIRLVDGKAKRLDGPFAETREQLGGFYLLECSDREQALAFAAEVPWARSGSVEVRALFGHEPGLGAGGTGDRYIILIYGEEAKFLPTDGAEFRDGISAHRRLTERLMADGQYVAGDALLLTKTATTVRVRNGGALRTDGPFAETREQLGGFYLFTARDMDQALDLAAQLPLTPSSSLEVRRVAG